MAVTVRIPAALDAIGERELTITPAPATVGALLRELERRYPDGAKALDSSSVNAAVNGEVILHGRDATTLRDGDEVEFLIMFAGG